MDDFGCGNGGEPRKTQRHRRIQTDYSVGSFVNDIIAIRAVIDVGNDIKRICRIVEIPQDAFVALPCAAGMELIGDGKRFERRGGTGVAGHEFRALAGPQAHLARVYGSRLPDAQAVLAARNAVDAGIGEAGVRSEFDGLQSRHAGEHVVAIRSGKLPGGHVRGAVESGQIERDDRGALVEHVQETGGRIG